MLIEEVKFDETESKKGKKETSKKEPAKKGVAPKPKSGNYLGLLSFTLFIKKGVEFFSFTTFVKKFQLQR